MSSQPLPDAEQPTKLSKLKLHAKRLALSCGTLVVLALVLEAATRVLTDTVPPLTVKDPVLGQRQVRDFQANVFDAEAGREVFLRFNHEGFRGPDWTVEKPPGVRRIALLGDSMIAALGVDEERTMACQLQRMLAESRPDVKWEVLNFGVPGSSPGQELVLYRKLVSQYDPDIVLCAFFVGNDLADNCSRLSHNPRIYFDLDESGDLYQLPFSVKRAKASQWLNRHSRFYVWQKTAFRKARRTVIKKTGSILTGFWIFSTKESEDLAHAWRLTGRLSEEFHREVTEDGRQFAMLMIPSSRQIYDEPYQAMVANLGEQAEHFDPDHPERRMDELCRRDGVPLASLTERFRQAAPAASIAIEDEWLFFNGTGHFNERGNALAAQVAHDFLIGRGPHRQARRPFIGKLR